MTTLAAHVTTNAITSGGKKQLLRELLRIVAYIFRVLPKFSVNRTNSGSKNDPDELMEGERRLLHPAQREIFLDEKRNMPKLFPLGRASIVIVFPPQGIE